MRAIWKGAISFGLVSIPVKLYTAIEERDISFHQVHRDDGGRIRYRRVCSIDGDEVPYSDIAKGYELPGGEMVVLTDEDLADLPLSTSRTVDVLSFVPLEQVDPIYFARSYYLEPDKTAAKPYVLLRDALERSGMVALVKVAIRTKESLATLRVRDGVLVLETMVWPDELRAPEFDFLADGVAVRPQELSMAESLIESMAGDFDPTQYHDDYREALQQVVEAKIEGREIVEPPAEAAAETSPAVDLMAALRASVAAAKRSRGEQPDADEPAEAPAARRTRTKAAPSSGKAAATRKAPAKKAAASAASSRDGASSTAQKTAAKAPAKAAAKAPAKAAKKAAKKTAARRSA
jgi:DNA end-binding protein Ku